MNIKETPTMIELLEKGLEDEINEEITVWNERLYETSHKGTSLDRFPLSPSQGARCSLALARDVSHRVRRGDYPRSRSDFNPRTQRVFARGHLLESAMVADIEKYTPYKITEKQTRLKLFPIGKRPDTGEEVWCEGNSDGLAVWEEKGSKVLFDFKSKGARYSQNFSDTIEEMFQDLRQTGLVKEIRSNAFEVTDMGKLFSIMSLNEFIVDYFLQLNGYAFGFRNAGIKVDFVSLFYENKNTEAYYEIRWVPDVTLFEYVQKKYRFIWDAVWSEGGAESVPKEYSYGSSRCFLCKYNDVCYPKAKETKNDPSEATAIGELNATLDKAFTSALHEEFINQKVRDEILSYMQDKNLRVVRLSNGLKYERKHLKSPKPHYELRLTK